MSHQSDLIETDIDAYLAQHEQKELLRFLTCGNVDDGKSTLIGRLLHDSKMIYEDQLEAVRSDNVKHGTTGEKIDLALLVDGLQAEREQGITIDVAYRYFSTAKRKFIIADTPGHEQYTRNMATGASTCDLAVILIDARYGVQTQTRRHSFIASLLGIKHIIVAVNKMDLMDFSEETFESIKGQYQELSKSLNEAEVHFVPLSALDGDNVVNLSERTPWYTAEKHGGKTLMQLLESIEVDSAKNFDDFRYPVQYVNRPNLDYRGFCGTVASGVVKVGDELKVLPSGKSSKVKTISTFDGDLPSAFAGQAVTLLMEDEIDISRGDMLIHSDGDIDLSNNLNAHVVWMSEAELAPGKPYLFKFASKTTPGKISNIDTRIDVNSFEKTQVDALQLNDIAIVNIELEQSVAVDAYKVNRSTGAFIVIDRLTNITVGAGMLIKANAASEFSHTAMDEFESQLETLIASHFPQENAKTLAAKLSDTLVQKISHKG